jgi:hypothetical protein
MCEMCLERLALFDIDFVRPCDYRIGFVCAEDFLGLQGAEADMGELLLVVEHIEHGVLARPVTFADALRIAGDAVAGGVDEGPPPATAHLEVLA